MKNLLTLIIFVFAAGAAVATPIKFWWSGDLAQEGQMTMYNPSAEDGDTGIPVYAADIDNDGFMDAILSCITGDGQNNNKPSCGELHVLFGVDSIRGQVDFSEYDGAHENLFTVWGRSTRDYFGSKTAAGDLDGDGIKDLIVGASWGNTPDRENSGEVYIIWGGSHLRNRFADIANAQDWNDLEITNVVGAEADDKLGIWVSTGDVNGDEHVDLLIGAPRANGFENDEAHDQTGEAYLLYGPFTRGTEIDLANPSHPMTVVFGVDPDDQMGNTLELGDINGDGFDDLILGAGAIAVARLGDTSNDYPFETGGAGDGPGNTRDECGEVYIVFGNAALPDTINLADGMPENSTIIYGAHGIEGQNTPGGDEFGEEITLGDINGDGIIDVNIGAFRANGRNNDLFRAGANFLFYGRHLWPSVIDLAQGIPDSTTAMYGGGEDWQMGDSTPLGDVNGDGFFDIQCGSVHDAGPYNIHESGTVRIVYGQPELLPPVIDFADLPDTMFVTVLQGSDAGDLVACWATTGDFNNDGYWDLIPNVMHGDGPNNARHNAGDFYIISGEWITNHPGQPRFLNATPDSDRVLLNWHDNAERGMDSHVIYRRDPGNGLDFDSVGYAPWPDLSFIDSSVAADSAYEYRLKAVSVAGLYSNPSSPVEVALGRTIGSGLPLIVNGIHWGAYGSEVDNFYEDEVLLGGAPFNFWDLYSTGSYPGGITPLGFGIDSLADYIFDAPLVLWMLNGFDPDSNYNDGHMLLDSESLLTQYLQAGGRLVIIGKELDTYLPPQVEAAFAHVVNWGFDNTITNTAELTPVYPGLGNIGKRASASNISDVPPYSIDDSGCPLTLYAFANSSYQWMGGISRGTIFDSYNICYLSTRPYRADPTELRAFMEALLNGLLGRYPAPSGLSTEASAPGEITVRWDASIFEDVLSYRVLRQEQTGGPVDTLGPVAAGIDSLADNPPMPIVAYNYWIYSEHENGVLSLNSTTVLGFSPPQVADGPILIVNGLDWNTYGQQAVDLYASHALQGARPFVFWDLFSYSDYPPGYEPIGFGIDSLVTYMWDSGTIIWVHNNFNGDGQDFEAMLPLLDAFLLYGGNLFLIGKEFNQTLSAELENRLGISEWVAGADWPSGSSALAEHPLLATVNKAAGQTMSLAPEFKLTETGSNLPLFRLTDRRDSYLGVAASSEEGTPMNIGLFSVRPYRAELTELADAMDYILGSLLGQALGAAVDDLIVQRSGSPSQAIIDLSWSAVPGAVSYIICRKRDSSEPSHSGTVFGFSPTPNWSEVSPPTGSIWFYEIFPVFE